MVEILVDLATQVIDIDIHHIRIRIEVLVPDIFQQGQPALCRPLVLDQIFEQAVFLYGQVDHYLATDRPVAGRIECQVSTTQKRYGRFRPRTP